MSRVGGLVARYRDMATDVAWSAISNVLVVAVNITSFILLFGTLDETVYGGYVGTYGVIGPLGALTWSGLSLLILQRVIREKDDPKDVFRRVFSLTTSQGILAATLAVLIANQVISTLSVSTIVLMAVAELVVFPVSQSIATMVQAVKGFAAAAPLRILVPVVRLSALLLTQVLGLLTVRNLAIAWIIGFSITGLISLFVVLPHLGVRIGFRRPPTSYVRGNLELALPLTASNLQINGDKAVMNGFGFEADAGFYGAAYRVIMLSQLPIKTMNQALFQRFLPDDRDELGQHLRRAKRFVTVSLPLSVSIAIVIYFTAPWLEFLVGDKIDDAIPMIRYLLPVVPLFSMSRAPLNGLLGLGRTTMRAGIIISSAVLSMTLYLSLIPTYSWRGAVIGTIVAEVYLASLGWFLLFRAQAEADEAAGVANAMREISDEIDIETAAAKGPSDFVMVELHSDET